MTQVLQAVDRAAANPVLASRRRGWKPKKSPYGRGVLAKYRRLVGSASHGAVTDEP